MKIEMHIHTSEASPCANVSASKTPLIYKDAGYDAIVITDHYSKWVEEQSGSTTQADYTEYFLNGYHTALKAGKEIGLPVFLGAEVNLPDSPNDYLMYGADEEFFRMHPGLYLLSLKELYALCHSNDILLIQAHPYRTYCTPADPRYLDGAESFNGNPRHDNRNDMAGEWVRANHLIPSSGSDFHETEDLAKGGIETKEPVQNIQELYQTLKNRKYHLLKP